MQFARLSRCLAWAAVAALTCWCGAQVMQAPGTMPDGRRIPIPGVRPPRATPRSFGSDAQPAAATPQAGTPSAASQPNAPSGPSDATAAPAAPAPRPLPPSLSDKPAQAARITLSGGQLSVEANNSSLSEILEEVSSSGGMTIDGLDKDQRVFGVYGPGNPRDIIAELLDGAGYNFLMVGQTDAGTPREIVLTTRSNAPLSSPGAMASSQAEEEEEPAPNNYPTEQVTPPPAPPAQQNPVQPRTPQQIIQELQQMRQQQQQQQAPQ